jgi:Zn ribbon nucleic-acid-binding protein
MNPCPCCGGTNSKVKLPLDGFDPFIECLDCGYTQLVEWNQLTDYERMVKDHYEELKDSTKGE